MRTCGSRSSPGVRSRAVGESVGQISHIAGPHPLSLVVRRYPLFPLGEKQTSPPPLCGAEWEWLGLEAGARAVVGLHPAGILLVRVGAW